jgi:aldehyde dehydrogenase (NAD+)
MNGGLGSFIAGAWATTSPGGGTVREIYEPARRDHLLWTATESTAQDAGRALMAARQAFRSWRRTPPPARGAVLLGAAAHLHALEDVIAEEIALEQGKTLTEARREVASSIASLRYFAGQASNPIGELLPPGDSADRIWAERVPLGPVVCITPWNFPLLIPTYKLAAAILSGNTVVFKPAPVTPHAAVRLIEALAMGGLPPGVVNLVLGGADLAEALLGSSAVRGVSFTGSGAVGTTIARRLAGTDVRLQLELGGKNPVLVLSDADIEAAARDVVEGAMGMAGQRCSATSRVIVQETIHDSFIEAAAERLRSIRVGHPLEPDVTMGPLISSEQQRSVLAAIQRAVQAGALLVEGGGQPNEHGLSKGNYVAPTLFAEVDPRSELAQEELFGPVLAVLKADSVPAAVELANATRFGLSAAIHTRDLGHALHVIDELDFGVVHVNRPTFAVERYAPFGGVKASGSGTPEQGHAAREFFTEWKTVYISAPAESQGHMAMEEHGDRPNGRA